MHQGCKSSGQPWGQKPAITLFCFSHFLVVHVLILALVLSTTRLLPSSVSSVIEEEVSCSVEFEEFESLLGEAELTNMDSENVILGSALVLADSGRLLGQHDWAGTGGM
jgi:hypothetical protein